MTDALWQAGVHALNGAVLAFRGLCLLTVIALDWEQPHWLPPHWPGMPR